MLTQRDSLFEQTRLTRRQIIEEANNRISIYPVLEIPPHADRNHTTQLQTAILPSTSAIAAVAAIDIPIQIFDSSSASPYAQRKSVAGQSSQLPSTTEIHIVDNHYAPTFDSSTASSDSDSLSRFTIIN